MLISFSLYFMLRFVGISYNFIKIISKLIGKLIKVESGIRKNISHSKAEKNVCCYTFWELWKCPRSKRNRRQARASLMSANSARPVKENTETTSGSSAVNRSSCQDRPVSTSKTSELILKKSLKVS